MLAITKHLKSEIKSLENKIASCKAKLELDYTYNFEWGYSGDAYLASYKMKQLKGCLSFIEKEPQRTEEWLKHNVDSIKKELLRGGYYGTSTSVFSNLAHLYKKEVSAELYELYNIYLDWIDNP